MDYNLTSFASLSISKYQMIESSVKNNFSVVSQYPQNVDIDSSTFDATGTSLYIKVSNAIGLLSNYFLYAVHVKLKFTSQQDDSNFAIAVLQSDFKENQTISLSSFSSTSELGDDGYSSAVNAWLGRNAVDYGIIISGKGNFLMSSLSIEIEYASPYYISSVAKTPKNGVTLSRRDSINFTWELRTTSYYNNPPSSAINKNVNYYTFLWKSDDSDVENEILLNSLPQFVSSPNQFLTQEKIYWAISGVMENGCKINPRLPVSTIWGSELENEWYEINLTDEDTISHCDIISPKNATVDGKSVIKFEWLHINQSGTDQTKAEIQTGTSIDNFNTTITIYGSEKFYNAPANSFSAGDLYWRVRTYNADGVAGDWSETAHIIVISAPEIPLLILERISPRPIVRWESDGQISFEVEIVGVESAQQYGSESRYEGKTILEEGIYTIRVRVQNKYSLWSPWAEASLTVFNAPGGTISLSATASKTGEVQLSWSTTGAFISFQILRNGAVIGETTERSYLDRLAIGACSYQIRGILDSAGNYSLSGVQALTVTVPTVQIAPVSGGDWLALPYTTTDIREVSVSTSKSVTYQQFLGAPLPVGVVGEALSKSVQLSCAFPYRLQADAATLEALIGQLVCVKDPRGRRYLGILGSMSHVSSRFYLSYSLTITPVTCEEVEL